MPRAPSCLTRFPPVHYSRSLQPCSRRPGTRQGRRVANSVNEEHGEGAGGDLAAIDGVERVVLEAASADVWLVLRPGADPQAVEDRARTAAPDRSVHLLVRPDRRDRQRVRFVEVVRDVLPDQQVTFRVVLEWAGRDYVGEATGEKGGAVELRTIATAALHALAAIVPGEVEIKLAGVKQVRAFDADMVVVSLYRADARPHSLVGAVVIGEDIQRAAAVAVLSALNRLLGNYLQLP